MLNKFRSSGRGKGTSIFLWLILGLLMLGLTGLGLGGAVSGLAGQNVARVGDEPVSREDYVRTLLNRINALSRQFGQPITMAQARLFGLDTEVLSQMVTRAALDGKTQEMGLSVGDETVARQLLQAQNFTGVDGRFDAQSYEFYLRNNGLSASEYENRLRRDTARSMLELGIAAGTQMAPVVAETIVAFAGEERRFASVAFSAGDLDTIPETPEAGALEAYYRKNLERYTSEEARVVTYAALTPESLAGEVEVSEQELQDAYDQRAAQYNSPERRVVDLLAFGSEDEAEETRAAIEAGETSFQAVVEDRGLDVSDITQGPVTAQDLSAAAREAVFSAEGPGIVGPVATDLGPALYRVNAILAAEETAFEEVRDELRGIVAEELAADQVLDWIDPATDLVASGATLEELAAETPMALGELVITDTPGEGLAGDLAFRRDAFEAEEGEERDLIELADGGIAILRLERVEPPAPIPFEEVADQVASDWRGEQVQIALVARAEAMQAQLNEGRTITAAAEAAGMQALAVGPLRRDAAARPGLPSDAVSLVFELAPGESTVVSDLGQVFLIQLTEVIPVDTSDELYAQELEAVQRDLNGSYATSLYLGFAQMVTDRAGVSVNDTLIDETLAQYP